jgi:hypothetical protein
MQSHSMAEVEIEALQSQERPDADACRPDLGNHAMAHGCGLDPITPEVRDSVQAVVRSRLSRSELAHHRLFEQVERQQALIDDEIVKCARVEATRPRQLHAGA